MKSIYENLVSSLTHIINSSKSENFFPIQWKMAKISFAPQKTKKHLADALIISKIDYGNITYSNASQNYLM